MNGKIVPLDYKLKHNEKIVHNVVRKEPPVFNEPKITILHEDDDFVAVDKPPSMPVHEGGSYKYNTLLGILEHEGKRTGLNCTNRLDKQTSGVVFLAKNEKAANEFRLAMHGEEVSKEYFARV